MVAGPTESEHDRAKSPESWIPAYAITILPILDPGTDQTAPDGGLCNLNLHSMAFRAYLGGLSALYSCKLSALNGASSWSAGSRVHAKAETRPPWANIEPKTSSLKHESSTCIRSGQNLHQTCCNDDSHLSMAACWAHCTLPSAATKP